MYGFYWQLLLLLKAGVRSKCFFDCCCSCCYYIQRNTDPTKGERQRNTFEKDTNRKNALSSYEKALMNFCFLFRCCVHGFDWFELAKKKRNTLAIRAYQFLFLWLLLLLLLPCSIPSCISNSSNNKKKFFFLCFAFLFAKLCCWRFLANVSF